MRDVWNKHRDLLALMLAVLVLLFALPAGGWGGSAQMASLRQAPPRGVEEIVEMTALFEVPD